jgi:hypothetical protein
MLVKEHRQVELGRDRCADWISFLASKNVWAGGVTRVEGATWPDRAGPVIGGDVVGICKEMQCRLHGVHSPWEYIR